MHPWFTSYLHELRQSQTRTPVTGLSVAGETAAEESPFEPELRLSPNGGKPSFRSVLNANANGFC